MPDPERVSARRLRLMAAAFIHPGMAELCVEVGIRASEMAAILISCAELIEAGHELSRTQLRALLSPGFGGNPQPTVH